MVEIFIYKCNSTSVQSQFICDANKQRPAETQRSS